MRRVAVGAFLYGLFWGCINFALFYNDAFAHVRSGMLKVGFIVGQCCLPTIGFVLLPIPFLVRTVLFLGIGLLLLLGTMLNYGVPILLYIATAIPTMTISTLPSWFVLVVTKRRLQIPGVPWTARRMKISSVFTITTLIAIDLVLIQYSLSLVEGPALIVEIVLYSLLYIAFSSAVCTFYFFSLGISLLSQKPSGQSWLLSGILIFFTLVVNYLLFRSALGSSSIDQWYMACWLSSGQVAGTLASLFIGRIFGCRLVRSNEAEKAGAIT